MENKCCSMWVQHYNMYSDYPKSLISRINEVYVYILLKKKTELNLNRLFCCNHTCYCANVVSVTSASHYITSALCYQPRYQSRSSVYIRGLIPRNFAELAETVPIEPIYRHLRFGNL